MRKILVVGTHFGKTYLDAAKNNPNWEIAGIVAKTRESIEKTGKQYNIPKERRFTDINKALKETDADAVVIAVPNSLHYEFATKVINANKHLILEKPIVETWNQAKHLIQLLDSKPHIKAMVGQTLRGDVMLRLMAKKIQDGLIGKIEQITFEAHWYWLDDPKKSWRFTLKDMFLDDIAIHHFDLIRMLLGNRKCTHVMAKTYRPPLLSPTYQHHRIRNPHISRQYPRKLFRKYGNKRTKYWMARKN